MNVVKDDDGFPIDVNLDTDSFPVGQDDRLADRGRLIGRSGIKEMSLWFPEFPVESSQRYPTVGENADGYRC